MRVIEAHYHTQIGWMTSRWTSWTSSKDVRCTLCVPFECVIPIEVFFFYLS